MLKIFMTGILLAANLTGASFGLATENPPPPSDLTDECPDLGDPVGTNACQMEKGIYLKAGVDKMAHVWMECKKVRSDHQYFIGARNTQEWTSFKDWTQNHPDKVTISPCD